MAIVAWRWLRNSRIWINIHSDMSKLLLPVLASSPESPWKLVFFGRFALSRLANSELVTHGGLPMTRIGSGNPFSIRPQSILKKSPWKTWTVLEYDRAVSLLWARSMYSGLTSIPIALVTDVNRSRADNNRYRTRTVWTWIYLRSRLCWRVYLSDQWNEWCNLYVAGCQL